MTTNQPPNQGIVDRIKNSTAGVLIDKIFSLLAGIAAALLFGFLVPVADAVSQLFLPWQSFLEENILPLIVISFASVVFWKVIWKRPKAKLLLPYILAVALVVIACLMRDTIIPNNIRVQFLLFAAGVLIFGEAAFLHLCGVAWSLAKEWKSIRRA